MPQTTYSAKELLSLALPCLPGTERSINRRMVDLPFVWGKTCGAGEKRYFFENLPAPLKKAILAREEIEALVPVATGAGVPAACGRAAVNLPALSSGRPMPTAEKQKVGYQKAALVRLYMQALAAAPWGAKDATRDAFMVAYNSGRAYPELYKALGELTWKTVEAWKVKIKRAGGDTLCLADGRGITKKGQRSVTPVQAAIILAVVRQPKGKSRPMSEIIRLAKEAMAQIGHDTVSDATCRRFLNDWIAINYDEWVWWREGDKGLNDKCLFWVERDYDRIAVGDILVADGHILNFTILNPWTGKPARMMLVLFFDMKSSYPLGWETMPTENTASISVALRRAILRLGKTPKIVYLDNGRAFKGHYFTGVNFEETELPGVYKSLGINLIVAKPYHGQSKTIERFFKEFGELERLAPSFCGTSIDTKPAHLHRAEQLHKKIHEKITGGQVPTMAEAHQAVASWFDRYGERKHGRNSHMAGQRPVDAFAAGRGPGVDPLRLRVLLMKTVEKTIQARGVKVFSSGDWYYHPALYGRKHKVEIRHDLPFGDSVLIYDARNGEFICEAFRPGKIHPAARILGTDQDVAALEGQLEMIGSLRKQTIAGARAFAEETVVPEAHRQIENAGFAVRGQEPEDRSQKKKIKQIELTRAETEQIMAEVEEAQRLNDEMNAAAIRAELNELGEADRYEKMLEMEMQGMLLCRQYRAFMRYYELTQEYEKDLEYWNGRRSAFAVMYGQKEMADGDASAEVTSLQSHQEVQ